MSTETVVGDLWIAHVTLDANVQVNRAAATRLEVEQFVAGLERVISDAASARFGADHVVHVVVSDETPSNFLAVRAWSAADVDGGEPYDEEEGYSFDEATGIWHCSGCVGGKECSGVIG